MQHYSSFSASLFPSSYDDSETTRIPFTSPGPSDPSFLDPHFASIPDNVYMYSHNDESLQNLLAYDVPQMPNDDTYFTGASSSRHHIDSHPLPYSPTSSLSGAISYDHIHQPASSLLQTSSQDSFGLWEPHLNTVASGADPSYDFSNLWDFSGLLPIENVESPNSYILPSSPSQSSTSSISPQSSCPSSPLHSAIHSFSTFQHLSDSSRETSPASSTDGDQQQHDQRRRFPCSIPGCSRRFTSQYTLKVHLEAHKPKPRSSFPCTLGCSERFSRQHDRLRHEVAKHGKICEWLCDDCGRFFSTKKTLGNHKCPVAPGGTRWVNN